MTNNGEWTMIAGRRFPEIRRMVVSRGLWGVVLSGVLVSGSCWLSAADEAPSTGLRGILPAAIPSDLAATTETLPENWKELTTLYVTDNVDVTGQRQAIAALRARKATLDKHSADPRYRAILPQLVSLSGSLKRRLDTAEAALDSIEAGPDLHQNQIAAAGQQVAEAARALESKLGTISTGPGWVRYLQAGQVRSAVSANDADKTLSTLTAVQTRLKGKEELADARARDFLKTPPVAAYEQAIDAYLAAVAAPVATANNPELRKNLAELLSALEQYEDTHTSASSATVRKAYEAVRGTSPDGGAMITSALRNNYFNYNLRVIASEAFLSKIIGQSRDETGPVRDFILGADVYGMQTTHTVVSIDLIPSNRNAMFDLVAQGAIASNTQGVTGQATIFTNGNHYFTASKRIGFDGQRFWTQPARINVSANNTTTGAETHIPFANWFARGIAVRKAEGMRGESEAIAASRVQDRVLPQFNSEVDKQFAPAGKNSQNLSRTRDALQELKLNPDAESWSSTDSELRHASRLMAPTELGGNEPNPALVLGRGATILLHESMINNATDRLELAGKTMSEDELQAKLEGNFSKLLGREVKFKKKEKAEQSEEDQGPKTFVFDKNDPIRVAVADGRLTVTLRTGFQQEGKEDIPTQIVTLPVTFSVDVKNVVIEPGDVSIAAAEPAESAAKQLARAGVIKKKISSAFPRTEVDRVRYVTVEKKKVLVAVTRIRALDGWLSITVE
jgi:tetratricopeptide (TPR) repeat protein